MMKHQISDTRPLLEQLETLYPDSSRRTLRNFLKTGRISLDGTMIVQPKHVPVVGQLLELHKEDQRIKPPLPVLYQDEYLLAVNKPSGLLSVPLDREAKPLRNALAILRNFYGEIYAVHRIDRETSGVLLFARSKKVRDLLHETFSEHRLERQYEATVEGKVKEDKGTWRSKLVEQSNKCVTSGHSGKTAVTHFEVAARNESSTRLTLTLETGRKHQIRVHCAEAGHPIIGDARYGKKGKRLLLRARSLAFKHPITNENIHIDARTSSNTLL